MRNLPRFEQPNGLTFTDRIYPSPFPEFPVLQWSYPYCWHPLVTMVVEALVGHGYQAEAKRVGEAYLGWVISEFERTGKLWEKIIGVPDTVETTVERYENAPFHGWASGSMAVIGRLIGLQGS